ncbi:3-oxosteroid 1-dehydrogenase [Synergistales bacterium]|nr:3-oxosteroid 1-dehydrogenase [Synergistales bacterium]
MYESYKGPWDHESDIVIVGFGGAGGCAAAEAHDAGADVVILEKQPQNRHYSNTRMSGGGFHSPEPTGDREALKAYAKAMFSGENLPWKFEGDQEDYSDGLAEMWAEYAPQNAAFMQSLDPDFHSVRSAGAAYPNFPGAEQSKYSIYNSTYDKSATKKPKVQSSPKTPRYKKEAGEAFHECLLHGINKRGIPIHYDTRVMNLLHDEAGEIIGVEAIQGKKTLRYHSRKAVILASGGYEYNKTLRSAFLDGPGVDGWAFYGTPANTGDGIIMGMESGAALSKVGSAAGRLIASFPDFRAGGIRIGVAMPAVGKPNAILVDNLGSRFCDEREITQNPTCYITYKYALAFDINKGIYPRIPAWFVFDENLRTLKALTHSNITEYFDAPWSTDNHEAIDRGWILKADTLEELGGKIKAHPDNHGLMNTETLCRSVSRFNESCAQGDDQDFHRELKTLKPVEKPPFYAIALFPGGPNTKGGLKANEKRQVLDWNGRVIPRLYAAGEIASVFKYMYQAGGNVGECIVCGRVAGLGAAREINYKERR